MEVNVTAFPFSIVLGGGGRGGGGGMWELGVYYLLKPCADKAPSYNHEQSEFLAFKLYYSFRQSRTPSRYPMQELVTKKNQTPTTVMVVTLENVPLKY